MLRIELLADGGYRRVVTIPVYFTEAELSEPVEVQAAALQPWI
jgi:hypothetical protein